MGTPPANDPLSTVHPPVSADAWRDLFCPHCGYNLRGIESEKCPECGREIDRKSLASSRIPWAHRRRIGRFRAFWKTVWMVTFNGQRLAEEMQRPVSHRDAMSFRWTVVAHAAVPSLIASAAILSNLQGPASPFSRGSHDQTTLAIRLLDWLWRGAVLISPLLWLMVITGVAGLFFHPRRLSVIQQNRAVALSQYSNAALSLMLPGLAGLVVATMVANMEQQAVILMAGAIALGAILLTGVNAVLLLKRTTHCGIGRLLALSLTLVAGWVLAGLFVFGFLPVLVWYIAIIVASFT